MFAMPTQKINFSPSMIDSAVTNRTARTEVVITVVAEAPVLLLTELWSNNIFVAQETELGEERWSIRPWREIVYKLMRLLNNVPLIAPLWEIYIYMKNLHQRQISTPSKGEHIHAKGKWCVSTWSIIKCHHYISGIMLLTTMVNILLC